MELVNPVIVIEVTSPSTMDIDRREKKDVYFEVPSIQAYLIIDQHRVCAELSTRGDAGWHVKTFEDLDDFIPLEPLDCQLALSQVYRGVTFEAQPD